MERRGKNERRKEMSTGLQVHLELPYHCLLDLRIDRKMGGRQIRRLLSHSGCVSPPAKSGLRLQVSGHLQHTGGV